MYTTFFNLILVTIHITPYLILKRLLLRQTPPSVFPPFNLLPFFTAAWECYIQQVVATKQKHRSEFAKISVRNKCITN